MNAERMQNLTIHNSKRKYLSLLSLYQEGDSHQVACWYLHVRCPASQL